MKLSPSAVGLLLALLVLALSEVQPALSQFPPEGNVIVLPQSISVPYGNDFTVNVQIQDVDQMTWFGFHVAFDPNLMRLDGYVFNPQWLGGGQEDVPGRYYFTAGFTGSSFNGTSTVLTVTFHCLAGGDSAIAIEEADWRKYGGYTVYFVQLGMATVSQVVPSTVTTTTTTSSISQTTATVTSWGYVTRSGTTTTTSLGTSVLTSVVTSVSMSVTTSVLTSLSTTGGPTVTSTLTSYGTTTTGTTTTITSVSTVPSPTTVTETTTSTESFEPRPLPTGCVIATAAYGSELAPDVAYMRYVRDDLIGSSILGSSLVAAFNAFYYSWSPALAEWIAESALLRAVFRILLLPLVGIVHVTALVFTATARVTGEAGAASLFAFLAAAMMTMTVYVLLPIMAAAKSRQAIRELRALSQLRHLGRIG